MSFNLIDPAQLGLSYEVSLSDEEIALLKVDDPTSVTVLLLLGKENNALLPAPTAPILINTQARLGMQKTGIRARIVFTNL